jgi:hypothetical protein
MDTKQQNIKAAASSLATPDRRRCEQAALRLDLLQDKHISGPTYKLQAKTKLAWTEILKCIYCN